MDQKTILDYTAPFSFSIPTRIEFGWEVSNNIVELLPKTGKICLFITEKFLLTLPPIQNVLKRIEEGGYKVQQFVDFEPEPDVSSIDNAEQMLRKEPVDVIVAVGGGSTIDVAKALSVALSEHRPVWEYVGFGGKQPRQISDQVIPIVAVPTTAGTGTEVTPYSVLSNRAIDAKATIVSPLIIPALAIVDPSLTVSLPPAVTAYTGADVLGHAIESYLNYPARTPFSAMLNREAICTASAALVRAVEDGTDREARISLSWASLLGGLSISQAGTGLGHAIAEALGGRKHIAHGKTVAALLPALLRVLEEKHGLELKDLREDLGNPGQPASQQVAAIWQAAGLPSSVSELGVGEDFRPTLRQDALNAGWAFSANPVPMEGDDIDAILDYLW